jgi:hypothetical protein
LTILTARHEELAVLVEIYTEHRLGVHHELVLHVSEQRSAISSFIELVVGVPKTEGVYLGLVLQVLAKLASDPVPHLDETVHASRDQRLSVERKRRSFGMRLGAELAQ